MKKCTKCKVEKPFDEYHKAKSKKDGYMPSCKACRKIIGAIRHSANREKHSERTKKYYAQNKDAIDEKHRQWYWKNRDEVLVKRREKLSTLDAKTKNKERWVEWNEKNKDAIREYRREYHKNWRKQNPGRQKIYWMVCAALKEGKIVKPLMCQLCGKTSKLQGHHADYAKPLEVIWVCIKCHHKIHKG